MTVRNSHWYNSNAGMSYPVDDTATAVDDNSAHMPSNIVVDMNLRWPNTLGNYAFLSSVAVTSGLVTLTIQAVSSLDDVATFTPIAVVSLPRPVERGRMYVLQAQADGVGGWVVFGAGVTDKPYNGRFSTPRQAFLTPRAARPYKPLPVSGIGVLHGRKTLTGLVKLIAQSPIEIVKEQREIRGIERDVIVIRLVDTTGATEFPVPTNIAAILDTASANLFKKFAGPCSGRPESNTCGDPQPIEFINAVAPDCDGVITLEFAGCAEVTQITDGCGVAIDCALGLVDACLPAQIPNSEGLLPSEYEAANIPVPPVTPPPDAGDDESESLIVVDELPYVQCFSTLPEEFVVQVGAWVIADDDTPESQCEDETSPVYSESLSTSDSTSYSFSRLHHYYRELGSVASNTSATRNVIAWDGFDDTTMFRKTTTELKMLSGPTGSKHNGGITINYREHSSVAGQYVYYLAEIDYDTQEFRVARFNGTNFQTVVPVNVPGIQLDKWYRITVTVRPAASSGATITARLESTSDVGQIDVTLTVAVTGYAPSTGKYGLCTNRALTRFGFFRVEEA